jgi:hypothetical protein
MTLALLLRSVEEGVPGLRPPEQREKPPELGPLWIWPRTRAPTPNLTGKPSGIYS